MLEIGPLVGMIQIPGIKYGVSNVVTLATLNRAIEDVIDVLIQVGINTLDDQATFLAQCLEAWLDASGRREDLTEGEKLSAQNVVYQGRIMVSIITLVPACIWTLRKKEIRLISDDAQEHLTTWFKGTMRRAELLEDGQFIDKTRFKALGFLGSGGIGRFRDTLGLAILGSQTVNALSSDERAEKARDNRGKIPHRVGTMTNPIRQEIRTYVAVLFDPLNSENAAHSMPELGRLSDCLKLLFPSLDNPILAIPPNSAKLFATAAVEAWHRAVHSYLISCSLTASSPIWASVCGYYASHYAVRALAHLLGHVVLFERKLVIKMTLDGGAHMCHATKRNNKSREHRYYWAVVKDDATFASNPLFRENSDCGPVSDAAYRNRELRRSCVDVSAISPFAKGI